MSKITCPNCHYASGGYEDGGIGKYVPFVGAEGEFYALPIRLERDMPHDRDENYVYGCPNCNMVFMSSRSQH